MFNELLRKVLIDEKESPEYGNVSPKGAPESFVQRSDSFLSIEFPDELGIGSHLSCVDLSSDLEQLKRCSNANAATIEETL